VIYGAGPRTVLESHAKRADERLDLEDLRKATKVISRTILDLLKRNKFKNTKKGSFGVLPIPNDRKLVYTL
jgi:hypothetical protein